MNTHTLSEHLKQIFNCSPTSLIPTWLRQKYITFRCEPGKTTTMWGHEANLWKEPGLAKKCYVKLRHHGITLHSDVLLTLVLTDHTLANMDEKFLNTTPSRGSILHISLMVVYTNSARQWQTNPLGGRHHSWSVSCRSLGQKEWQQVQGKSGESWKETNRKRRREINFTLLWRSEANTRRG